MKKVRRRLAGVLPSAQNMLPCTRTTPLSFLAGSIWLVRAEHAVLLQGPGQRWKTLQLIPSAPVFLRKFFEIIPWSFVFLSCASTDLSSLNETAVPFWICRYG